MKAKVTKNMISFVTIRRGNWIIKVSVFKTKHVLIVAQHYYEIDLFHIRHFDDKNEAASFIEFLANEDIL